MAFVQTLYWKNIVDILSEASQSIYVSLPSIDEELAELLILSNKDRGVVIKVCIDNSEDVIRNGYGEVKGIDNLIKNDIEIKECKGNRVSFIIVDDAGYIIFPESRIFTDEPSGPNAIELDPFTKARLIAHYFPAVTILEKEQLYQNYMNGYEIQMQLLTQIDSEVVEQKAIPVTQNFNSEIYKKTKQSLDKVPPIEPDLQRRIKTYTAKVQFVELRFTGVNLQARTINIPKDAIPISNAELKNLLLTKMKLFQNMDDNQGLEIFRQLKKRVELLREDYLKPITCREGKSLVQVDMKEAFIGRLSKIKNEIQEINKQLPDILETATLQTKDLISAELIKFFNANLPESIKQYNDPTLRDRKLNDFVDGIVRRIPFPKTEKLIEKISLNDYYYDLTFQDFSDEKLIQELQKKEIMKDEDIKGIVEMKNAFAVKKNNCYSFS